jgi:hypothetical protein
MDMFSITRADMNAIKSALETAAAELEIVVLDGDIKEDVLIGIEEALSILTSVMPQERRG